MKGNNLSNRHAPIIAIRAEGILLQDVSEDSNLIQRVLHSHILLRKLNLRNVRAVNSVWRSSDYSINLYVVAPEHLKDKLDKKLEVVYHSRLFCVGDLVNLREHLESQYTLFYFDVDPLALSVVGKPARNFEDFLKIVR